VFQKLSILTSSVGDIEIPARSAFVRESYHEDSVKLREPDFIIGLLGLGLGIASLISGKNIRKFGGLYKRTDSPIAYWYQTVLQLLIGIVAIISAFLRRS